ncbi:hypothetical protein CSKR_202055 [Clonorchis sinensis]|uniref:Uncharacterized protein n=1 Tax=Clonorchis sinensis TaxID=79923 RepID=A0A8T1LWM7_CLOSI|nr:hypothetical protein CSKR_202055 [Clonorchis sinensis]
MARGIYGVGVALIPKVESSLLDWIPYSNTLQAEAIVRHSPYVPSLIHAVHLFESQVRPV